MTPSMSGLAKDGKLLNRTHPQSSCLASWHRPELVTYAAIKFPIVSFVRHFAQFGLVQVGEGNFDVSAIVHFDKGR